MGAKRIFISDVHMGDERSLAAPHSYVWFRKNVSRLADFLDELLKAPDVEELIILGDLFDLWIIPANYSPITKLENVCSSEMYQPVIEKLKALAETGIKLTYVPGNHDMALSPAKMPETKQFLEDYFNGMNYLCEETMPLGTYRNGTIAAEHGNRYCLFNAPDKVSNSGVSFLPLGYFISRLDAYKVCEKGHACGFFDTLVKFVEEFLRGNTHFVEDVFLATADDSGLGDGTIEAAGLPGYGNWIPVGDIAVRFRQIAGHWGQVPGTKNVDAFIAAKSDAFGLFSAAKATYFQDNPEFKVVIFGHTHTAELQPDYENPGNPNYIVDPDVTPCRTIYANSGAWTDDAKYGCTYVETEEDGSRLYVKVKTYPGNNILSGCKGFVEI